MFDPQCQCGFRPKAVQADRMSDYSLFGRIFHIIIRGDIMVRNHFKNEDENVLKETFNKMWKEYIERAERGGSDAG